MSSILAVEKASLPPFEGGFPVAKFLKPWLRYRRMKCEKGPCTRPNMSLQEGIARLRESEGIQSPERDRHRSPVVAREMSRQEVMLLLVALASLVQGQQLFNCQQRCGQFYVEFQKVREKNSLWHGGKPLSSLRWPSLQVIMMWLWMFLYREEMCVIRRSFWV